MAPAALLSGPGAVDPRDTGDSSHSRGRSHPGSVPATVLQALTGSATPGTLGVLLPGILAAIVLVGAVETILAWRRRERVRRAVRDRYEPPQKRKD